MIRFFKEEGRRKVRVRQAKTRKVQDSQKLNITSQIDHALAQGPPHLAGNARAPPHSLIIG
jgi:hypothetical protein